MKNNDVRCLGNNHIYYIVDGDIWQKYWGKRPPITYDMIHSEWEVV